LSASDNGLPGLASIHYRVNGGAWQEYGGAINVLAGDVVTYYATDLAGNAETAHDVAVPLVAGDINRDAYVDISDLTLMSNHYGQPGPWTWADGDFNNDGAVDISDLTMMSNNYGAGDEAVGAAGNAGDVDAARGETPATLQTGLMPATLIRAVAGTGGTVTTVYAVTTGGGKTQTDMLSAVAQTPAAPATVFPTTANAPETLTTDTAKRRWLRYRGPRLLSVPAGNSISVYVRP
jgi:hypothetical protein